MNEMDPCGLLVATRNAAKMQELLVLLADTSYKLLSLNEVPIDPEYEVEETGSTFEENAILKAEGYGAISGMMTLADDSGLEVDALGGAPGVLSARYGNETLDDLGRNELVLKNVSGLPEEDLTARFRCVVAIYIPGDGTVTFDGKIEGKITHNPRGSNGFGYDPLFFYPPKGKTLAEIPSKEKHDVSHRGTAVREAASYLRRRGVSGC